MPRNRPPRRATATYTAADTQLLIHHAAQLEKKGNPRLAQLIRSKLDRCKGKPERAERRAARLTAADAIAAGLHVAGVREISRPTFIVITPSGRRIETLEHDLA